MSEANSLILLPDGPGVRAGEQVNVLLIDPDRLSLRYVTRTAGTAVTLTLGVAVTTPVPVDGFGQTAPRAPRQ